MGDESTTTTVRYSVTHDEETETVILEDNRVLVRQQKPTRQLWWLHIVCGLLELGSALSVPIYTDGVPGLACYQSVYTNAGDVSVLPMGAVPVYTLVLMVFMAGVFEHTFCVILPDVYIEWVSFTNWFRWASYAVVWPLLLITVGYGSGIREGFILVMMAGLALLVILSRVLVDMSRRLVFGDTRIRLLMLLVGDFAIFWALLPVWGVYTRYVGSPPGSMSAMVALGTVLFLCGVIIPPHVMLRRKETPPDVTTEIVYCVVWTTGKVLVGHLFAGSLAMTDY